MANGDYLLTDEETEFNDAFHSPMPVMPVAPTGDEYTDAFAAVTNNGTAHLSQLDPTAFADLWKRFSKVVSPDVLWNMLYVKFPKPLMGERTLGAQNYPWTGKQDAETIAEKGVIPPNWYQQAPQAVVRDVLPNPLEVGDTKSLITPAKWRKMQARVQKPRRV